MDTNTLIFIALAIMIILIIICFVLNMINTSKINTLLDYTDDNDGDIISALKEYYDKVDALSKTITASSDGVIQSRITACENNTALSFKKVGIINFNAYDDVTGDLSFALALLNDTNDGVILTSLYGHNSCNTYVRQVFGGECAKKLLDEEKEALAKSKLSLSKE